MRRATVVWLIAFGVVALVGCRQPLDFDLAATADPERGRELYMAHCANTCHPDNAFHVRHVQNFNQLAETVRTYYEQTLDGKSYPQQDVFDMSRYLNQQYYHFKLPEF
ncbi:MAG TPA: hypothetical protein V6D47_15915 [Oscillatoriaceae cyanobacterium]